MVPTGKRLNPGEKVVVTQEGIDDWRAQLYGLDLNRFPKTKPADVPDGIFDELKKRYDSRYLHPQAKAPSKKPPGTPGTASQGKARVQTAQQRRKPEFDASSAYFSGTGAASQVQLEKSSSLRFMLKEEPPQAAQKSPSSYIPMVMHKAKEVETMISYLEPTEEQMAKREVLRQEQEELKRQKLEEERLERRARANMNLTLKQKQHAEKLYFLLDGNVSRKELEDSALSAKHQKRVRIEDSRDPELEQTKESIEASEDQREPKRPPST